jgi:hypothetical protein
MSFLKDIEEKKVVLRKTELQQKESKPEEMIVKDESDYFRLIRETYFEEYYTQIEEFTFKSVIVPLTLEDIKTIYDAALEFESSKTSEMDMTGIAQKIDKGIEMIRTKTNSECQVFVRLSSRSPKDAIYHLPEFRALYGQYLDQFEDKDDIFSRLHAFYKASTSVLSISTGIAATELMRKSNRIQGDLKACLDNKEPMNMIIRQFVQFPVKNELRGFVYNGVFTALTQYNNLAYFPEQKKLKSEVEHKVKEMMEKFISAMEETLRSFIVDIVLDEDGKVWVVEVNPFGELAGSCLFGWSKDREVLMGEKPFEFRIVEEKPSLGYIKSEVDSRVLELMGL